jgi:hypothetical protein
VDVVLMPQGLHNEPDKLRSELQKWNYDELKGDPALFQKLVDGEWNDEDFLVVQPGRKTAADVNNPGIIKAV